MSIRAVVIDDDRAVRLRIARLLAERPGFEFVGESDSGPGAADLIRREKPDLALVDVQLPGCSGIEVIGGVEPALRPVALFLTAFDYDAVEALEGARIGYLLKPISDQRLEAELTRAARIFEQGWRELFEQRLQKLLALSAAPEPWPQRFLVREGETVRTVELEAVEWIESQGDGVALHAAGREHPVRLTMQAIAQRLDPDRFLRIHRSTIVRLDRIARVEPVVAGEDVITLVSGASVRIGKTYRESVRSVLQGRLHESGGILFPAVRGRSSTGRATDF